MTGSHPRHALHFTLSLAIAGALLASPVFASEALTLLPSDGPAVISPEGLRTNKVKVLRLPDATLVAIYGLAQDVGQQVYDPKARALRDPYDIVVSTSIDEGATWTTPMNVSNTAASSSGLGIIDSDDLPPLDGQGFADLAADPRAVAWPGDSDKPNAFNAGNHVLITWSDKYCPGGEQRFVVYPELDGVTVPYSCLYASRLKWNGTAKAFVQIGNLRYKTERLTTGIRDVKSDANKGANAGFVVVWQEDPMGLQLGEADGPGEGASGAKTMHGTDIWYTAIATASNTDFIAPVWPEPTRVTVNRVKHDDLHSAVEMATHPAGLYDHGYVGASRPNVALVGSTAVIAYEETKGSLGCEDGKYVRYHSFPFTSPPAGGEVGCIVSDPLENGRRVRILTQSPSAGATQIVFIYKQGDYTEGGPSDILLRRAVGGLTPDFIVPGIDADACRSSRSVDTDPLETLVDNPAHLPAVNLSGSSEYAGDTGSALDAGTGDNPYENALAHRGLLRGDLVVIGYSHTPDLYRYTYLGDQQPYNFYLRRSEDGGDTWSDPYDLSGLDGDSGVSVREPRLVPTPSSTSNCPTVPENCQNTDVFWVGFGLETNVNAVETASDVDVYMTLSLDGGLTYFDPQPLTFGDTLGGAPDDVPDFETQLKIRPDGLEGGIVWSSMPQGLTQAVFRRAQVAYASLELEMMDGSAGLFEVVGGGVPRISELRVLDPKKVTDKPLPIEAELPFGMLDFTVTGLQVGGEVEVILTLDGAEELAETGELWKFAPTPADTQAHWYSVPATFEGDTVSFRVTDGGFGDADLRADGVIDDPVALVLPTDPEDPVDTVPEACGCSVPADAAQGGGLVLLLLLAGAAGLRRRDRTG